MFKIRYSAMVPATNPVAKDLLVLVAFASRNAYPFPCSATSADNCPDVSTALTAANDADFFGNIGIFWPRTLPITSLVKDLKLSSHFQHRTNQTGYLSSRC